MKSMKISACWMGVYPKKNKGGVHHPSIDKS